VGRGSGRCAKAYAMNTTHRIGLVDCNNFFVSCERVFCPALAHVPMVVLSSNDGCVISRSPEAKQLGIPMGIPYVDVRSYVRKHNVVIRSSNFPLYNNLSTRVMATIESVVTECEPYSIDEAFFLTHDANAAQTASTIRQRVMKWVGIPVSVGVAHTKTLAKLAGDHAKNNPYGVCVFNTPPHDGVDERLLCDVWGVGPQSYHTLQQHGIHTVGDVRHCDASILRSILGVHGERLHYELSGVPTSPRVHEHTTSYTSTQSFGTAVRTHKEVQAAVMHHLSVVAERLRLRRMATGRITILLGISRGSERYTSHRVVMFPQHLSDTRLMARHSLPVLAHMFERGIRYRSAGIVASDLVVDDMITMSFLQPQTDSATPRLMKALDSINARHGKGAIHFGSVEDNATWHSRRSFLSPSYTTRWSDLPKAAL
jgi:DNA polymerase V